MPIPKPPFPAEYRRQIGEQMTAELVLTALSMASRQRGPDVVLHCSDQGGQYARIAIGESFFATLVCELIDRRSWQTKTEARLGLFTYIEGWYHPRRRRCALAQTSSTNFERRHIDKTRSQPCCDEHRIPTWAVGPDRRNTDGTPPGTTLRRAMPTSLNSRKVVQ